MRTRTFVSKAVVLSVIGILCAASAASAADAVTPQPEGGQTGATAGTTTSTTADIATSTQASAKVQTKLVTQFSSFAGSEANAQSLITGLRKGEPVTLAAPAASGPASPTLTIDTPTRPMGYGSVSISLALAKQQLADLGITQPTPQQIQTALTGGAITAGSGATAQTVKLPGILTLRSEGMGWGNIAKSQGMSLGKVMSSAKSAVRPPVTATASGSGIVTATGAPASIRNEHRLHERETEGGAERHFERNEHASSGRAVSAGPAARSGSLSDARPEATQAVGRGIVTGAGTSVTATGAAGFGHGRHSSAAVVTTGGGAATARGQGGEISHGRR